MSNLVNFAKSELSRLKDDSGEQEIINEAILEVVETFSQQGHSGFSAEYAINILHKLLQGKPITPLTGEEDEWADVREGTFQNKRCSSVFKDEAGFCYDLDAVTFYHVGDNFSFTNGNRVREYFRETGSIEFPYVPVLAPVWIEVPREEENEE